MKKILFLLIFLCSICRAQQQASQNLPPLTQSHIMPPWIQQYDWDTIGNNWTYVKTIEITYSGNHETVSYTHDTINVLPIAMDSTMYDTLGRITTMRSATWSSGWMNSSRTDYIYTDTSSLNRIRFRYAGNGSNWTLIQGDSVFNIFDANGNSIEKYFFLYNIPSGIFKPTNYSMTDYDGMNRVDRRRSFNYDVNTMQYVLGMIDSNFLYDAVYTDQVISQMQYNVSSGNITPFYWRKLHYGGPSIMDWTETALQFNTNTQQWDQLHRWTYTSQSCDNIDTAYLKTWNPTLGIWEMTSGTKDIFNWTDSCDYDEFIIQTWYPHLNAYRNDVKWVYPPDLNSGFGKLENAGGLILYPNPVHTLAKMENGNWAMEIGLMRIYNSIGLLVREEKIVNLNSYIFHRDGLNDGLYFYELSTLNYELIGSGKFIVE